MGCMNSSNQLKNTEMESMNNVPLDQLLNQFDSPQRFHDAFEAYNNFQNLLMYKTFFHINSIKNRRDPKFEMIICELSGPLLEMTDTVRKWREKSLEFNHPNLLMIHCLDVQQLQTVLVPTLKLTMLIDCPLYSLAQHPLLIKSKPLSEEEIWFLIDCISEPFQFMQSKKIHCPNLTLKEIFCVQTPSKRDVYKISDHFWKKIDNTGFSKEKRNVIMSPIQVQSIPHKIKYPTQNVYKTQIFVLGMICLYCMDLEPSINSYDWDNWQVKEKHLEQRIKTLSRYYTDTLLNLLQNMVRIDEKDRLDCFELNQEVSQIFENFGKQRLLKQLRAQDFNFSMVYVEYISNSNADDNNINENNNIVLNASNIQEIKYFKIKNETYEIIRINPEELKESSKKDQAHQKVMKKTSPKIYLTDFDTKKEQSLMQQSTQFKESAGRNYFQQTEDELQKPKPTKNPTPKLFMKSSLKQDQTKFLCINEVPVSVKSQSTKSALTTPKSVLFQDDLVKMDFSKQKQIHIRRFSDYTQKQNNLVYPNGFVYDGSHVQNKRHGWGILFNPKGQKEAEGNWIDDRPHGHIIYYNYPDYKRQTFNHSNLDHHYWVRFDGNTYDGLRRGKGRIVFCNWDCFEGEFKHDQANGKGAYFYASGDIIKGEWKDDIYVG